MPSAREDRSVVMQAGKQGEKCGKNELEPIAQYLCVKKEKSGKNEVVTRTANMLLAPNVNKYWNLCKGEKRG